MIAPLRVGVVGIGFGQHAHVPAFRQDARCRVTAIAASAPERAAAVAGRLEIERGCAWPDLVSSPDVDVVSIAVPPILQPSIARLAFEHGKHVFCEKPLAPTAAEAHALLEGVRRGGVVHAVDFEFRAVPAWERAREIVASGELGELRSVAASWRLATMAYRKGTASWKTQRAAGGGALNSFGAHMIDALQWFFGPVSRVMGWLGPSEASSEWRANLWLELRGGLPATVSIANDALLGDGHRIEVYGTQGTLVLQNRSADMVHGFELLVGGHDASILKPVQCGSLAAGGDGRVAAVAVLARRFVDAIEGGRAASPSFEDGASVARCMDAARRSNESGTWEIP